MWTAYGVFEVVYIFEIAFQRTCGLMALYLLLSDDEVVQHDVDETFSKFWHTIRLINQFTKDIKENTGIRAYYRDDARESENVGSDSYSIW